MAALAVLLPLLLLDHYLWTQPLGRTWLAVSLAVIAARTTGPRSVSRTGALVSRAAV